MIDYERHLKKKELLLNHANELLERIQNGGTVTYCEAADWVSWYNITRKREQKMKKEIATDIENVKKLQEHIQNADKVSIDLKPYEEQHLNEYVGREEKPGRKRVFLAGRVRMATEQSKKELEDYTKQLEERGIEVYLPHKDTNQNATGFEICTQNMEAIKSCDEFHVFYHPESQGTHFDMGMAFALGKKVVVVENTAYGPGKSFARMLVEWEREK